jgi:glycosyltransferase involved in cell wall biosynthesis
MRISTIIPCYNREDLIGETLRSILSQSAPPYEVIVIDDGSSDASRDVINSFGKDVRLICQSNHGAGAARNRGLQAASGDYVHFMDSDDLSSHNTYECQLDVLRATSADVVYGPWVKTRFDKDTCQTQPVVVQQRPLPNTPSMGEWVLRGWVTVFQPCLFRRCLITELGGYRVDLKPTEDSELLYRIGQSGAKLAHCPDSLLVYRVHPEGQVSVANVAGRQSDWLRFLAVMDAHCKKTDVTSSTRRQFEFGKLDATLVTPSTMESELRVGLLKDIPPLTKAMHKLLRFPRKVRAKLRRIIYGDNYMSALGAARVTAVHKSLIRELGYRHLGFFNDA